MATTKIDDMISKKMQELSKARETQRKVDSDVKRLKMELSDLSFQLVSQQGSEGVALSSLLGRYADCW